MIQDIDLKNQQTYLSGNGDASVSDFSVNYPTKPQAVVMIKPKEPSDEPSPDQERDTVIQNPTLHQLQKAQRVPDEKDGDILNQATFIEEEEISAEQEKKITQIELYRILFQDCLSLNILQMR